jgi:two-component system, chemotaxis family, CheB/CheR fusion protein
MKKSIGGSAAGVDDASPRALPERVHLAGGLADCAGSPKTEATVLPAHGPSFRAMVDAVPAPVYATDAEGRLTYCNEAAVVLWGLRPALGEAIFTGAWKLFLRDGTELTPDQSPLAIALRERRALPGQVVVAQRPDGSFVHYEAHPSPIFDAEGKLIGGVSVLVELTDRDEAEQTAHRLAAIVESSNDAIIGMDLEGNVVSWNAAAGRLFQYAPDEVLGGSVTILLPDDRKNEEIGILDRIRRGERVEHYETRRRRRDGEIVDISLTVSPIRGAGGRIVGASKIARDITEKRKHEEARAMLLGEMKHRIKNNLATVQSLATMTLRSASEEDRRAFLARLHALSGAHDLITHQHWDRASLRETVSSAIRPFQEHGRITCEGPDVTVAANKVLLLSLALHELATNAAKYGALSTETGRIAISWQVGDGALTFRWKESGGPRVEPPQRKGFGSQLVTRLFNGDEGEAEFVFDSGGLVCILTCRLDP